MAEFEPYVFVGMQLDESLAKQLNRRRDAVVALRRLLEETAKTGRECVSISRVSALLAEHS